MPRYKLTLEYDGTHFHGWQRQNDHVSVQQRLEEAASKMCKQTIAVVGAGRTDAGVHATGQVAHLDLPKPYELYKIQGAINHYLHEIPISVLSVEEVDEEFHARFSATGRSYRYRLVNRRAPLALEHKRAWLVQTPLDVDAMRHAAQEFVGTHDFTSFRAAACQAKSPIKTLDSFEVTQLNPEEIHFSVSSRSFLHHQVRNMVGTLFLVGEGKWKAEDIKQAFLAKNREAGGITAPSCGLYLTDVCYKKQSGVK